MHTKQRHPLPVEYNTIDQAKVQYTVTSVVFPANNVGGSSLADRLDILDIQDILSNTNDTSTDKHGQQMSNVWLHHWK